MVHVPTNRIITHPGTLLREQIQESGVIMGERGIR